jgi:hypothetical protein
MFTEPEIIEIIKQKIETDENLGQQSGGSGHLGFVSYEIKDYKTQPISPEQLEITYNYYKYVETEFTYYPDNPPMRYLVSKTILVGQDKKIISKS